MLYGCSVCQCDRKVQNQKKKKKSRTHTLDSDDQIQSAQDCVRYRNFNVCIILTPSSRCVAKTTRL